MTKQPEARKWHPTHRIDRRALERRNIQVRAQLDEHGCGPLYTRVEWLTQARPEWRVAADGQLFFRDRLVDRVFVTKIVVTARPSKKNRTLGEPLPAFPKDDWYLDLRTAAIAVSSRKLEPPDVRYERRAHERDDCARYAECLDEAARRNAQCLPCGRLGCPLRRGQTADDARAALGEVSR